MSFKSKMKLPKRARYYRSIVVNTLFWDVFGGYMNLGNTHVQYMIGRVSVHMGIKSYEYVSIYAWYIYWLISWSLSGQRGIDPNCGVKGGCYVISVLIMTAFGCKHKTRTTVIIIFPTNFGHTMEASPFSGPSQTILFWRQTFRNISWHPHQPRNEPSLNVPPMPETNQILMVRSSRVPLV